MAVVVIAEKPSVAEDIAKVLGVSKKTDTHWESADLIVTWAVGHLLELKTPEEYDERLKDWRKSIDLLPFIPENFELKPNSGRGSNRKQLTAIKKLISNKECSEIVNACDAAREGELIFRRIVEYAKSKVPMSRMWLQSMTPDSIVKAFDSRVDSTSYSRLRDAAVCRAEADWIIGMNGSRIASTFLRTGRKDGTSMSLGRVQTATLALIVDKELEILGHNAEPFWELEADFKAGSSAWTGRWERRNNVEDKDNPLTKAHRITQSSEKEDLAKILSSSGDFSTTQKHRDAKENPPLNYDLTSLQREANSLWSWTSRRTLSVAQELYDTHKLTTYPRTDSRYLPEDMKETINQTIKKLSAQTEFKPHCDRLAKSGLTNVKRNFNDSKVSDHYAIIPTGKMPNSKLSQDAAKLYDLITRQFLASFHTTAIWDVQTRIATKDNQDFVKEVRLIKEPGWREVKPKSNKIPDEWNKLPSDPAPTELIDHRFKEEQTKPTNRLKEAKLLSLMEHAGRSINDDEMAEAMKGKGLGTPATRAETIEKLIARNFIQRARSGSLRATPGGIKLIELLRAIPVEWITSPELTGDMEAKLSSVQDGKFSREEYMSLIYDKAQEMVDKIKNHDRSNLFNNVETIGCCPKCDENLTETVLSYTCPKNSGKDSGCDFIFWKNTSGRWFDRYTAKRLLENRELTDLHGFFNRNGEPYVASVKMNNSGNVEFVGGGESTSSSEDHELCACPSCENGKIRINSTMYACDNQECKFRGLAQEMCKRKISEDEAKSILVQGKSELLDDFISKKGRPFSAYLRLDGNRVKFEFPPRKAAVGAKEFPVVAGVVATCPKTKQEIVETPCFFQPANDGTDCKIQIAREMSSREITRDEAKQLIESGQIGPFDDFISKKSGKPFTSVLYLKKNQSVGYKFAKK
ncbi:MAG: DNA topoisomerase [Candidatus Thermoplasmatota archaeon]|nr:DNA topoisomerase [Candidatus Thermoplasmatota archaeon]